MAWHPHKLVPPHLSLRESWGEGLENTSLQIGEPLPAEVSTGILKLPTAIVKVSVLFVGAILNVSAALLGDPYFWGVNHSSP